MKKILVGVIAAFAIVIGSTGGASAAAPQTSVTGVVTKNQIAQPGANVTVTCGGSTLMDTTDGMGSYLVNFPSADCPFGSTVKVVGEKNGEKGVASGTVQGVTTKLNLAIVNVAIPEFGLIGALAAGGLGIGMITVVRRRQQAAQML
ncbi:MAG TPA: hypothetical protein VFT16_02675 [Candidatus Saccharimonadales bacterium]|nr:hypothetical protein [Candidatus Saccharimonadales bacterium]